MAFLDELSVNNHENDRVQPNKNTLNRYVAFFKCRKEWLETGEEPIYQIEEKLPSEHRTLYQSAPPADSKAKQDEKDYDPHGGWKPKLEGAEWSVMSKAFEILSSDTVFKAALIQNIEDFHTALKSEGDKASLNARVKKVESLIAELSEENRRLKEKVGDYRRKEQRRQRDLGPPAEGERRTGRDRRISGG